MRRAIALAACALGLLIASTASAQQVITGTVVRIDPPAQVVVLDDGRMFQLGEGGAVLINDQPVAIMSVQPGSTVVIRSGQPVMLREGQYVVVAEPAAPRTAGSMGTVVASAPPPIVVTPPRSAMVETASGRIARLDLDHSIVVLDDGRVVQLTPKSVALSNGHPVALNELVPGMSVTITSTNPVVSRDGRNVLLNEGVRDADNGSTLTWDSRYAGYEADIAHGGMQIQAGGD